MAHEREVIDFLVDLLEFWFHCEECHMRLLAASDPEWQEKFDAAMKDEKAWEGGLLYFAKLRGSVQLVLEDKLELAELLARYPSIYKEGK